MAAVMQDKLGRRDTAAEGDQFSSRSLSNATSSVVWKHLAALGGRNYRLGSKVASDFHTVSRVPLFTNYLSSTKPQRHDFG